MQASYRLCYMVKLFPNREMLISEQCLIYEKTLANCNENGYLGILLLSGVEWHCKLPEKILCATQP